MKSARTIFIQLLSLILIFYFLSSCNNKQDNIRHKQSTVTHPVWSKNLGVYEVNLRQFSEQSTLLEFADHLPRIKNMGVGILYFLPIHPVGKQNKRGKLGNPYSVQDYFTIDPAYGSMEIFRQFVDKVHRTGLYVVIDWVAAQCAPDNEIAQKHPEWFKKESAKNHSDILKFNYDNDEMRNFMLKAMKFWAVETGIDGFRCASADEVPIDFWIRVRQEIQKFRPLLMLADSDNPVFHKGAFDMTYNTILYDLMNNIAQGNKTAADLEAHFMDEAVRFGADDYRILYTSNYQANSRSGTVFQRLGDAAAAFAVLTATAPGVPLIYGGQEAGLDKRLALFEKDLIPWKTHSFNDIYRILLQLKRKNKALWNGSQGAPLLKVVSSNDTNVFAFLRMKSRDRILVILNLSPRSQTVTLNGPVHFGEYIDVFNGHSETFAAGNEVQLPAWAYRVYRSK